MVPKLKRKKQPTITEHALPQLKKPMEAVGKQVEFPGSFWGGRMSPEELLTLYTCTVRDYSSIAWRTSSRGAARPRAGLRAAGDGRDGQRHSTEHGDADVLSTAAGSGQPTECESSAKFTPHAD
jgi:hypothetical protein